MSKKEKLIQKLLLAKTFKFSELVSLLKMLGYTEIQGDGSRVKFDNGKPEDLINLHKPHPGNEMKAYAVKQVKEKLQRGGLI
ncbi:MAG: type II toxin-antitoxin system HicA family toxin [Thiotrichaceae bacterium]|nr:type II toxin-antitoxin system HicA family toxin [Thiotrichaceae bacterium]